MRRLSLGFTLTELMIACALGLGMYAAVISYSVKLMQNHQKLAERLQLEEELSALTDSMQRELRRAGYHGTITSMMAPDSNWPDNLFAKHTRIEAHAQEAPNSCILFSYDVNHNGSLDTEDPNEQMGFRLKDRAVELRQNGLGCQAGGWHDLTNSRIVQIEELSFSLLPYSPSEGSLLTIRVQASLKKAPAISHLRILSVRMRNVPV
ncbi:hypothetical protein DXV75_02425 [Alteromonas aestuariivivens]|uniref:Prepilin-type N-terminal cleavage/methylation domain-containing protein n=1 Tax=Alteromonas aestuariivivens TaxID=1938339 RepID=A0A3D8MES4_9ALTE|nr:hypothetical protein [Alteromonas aestuariivivens]RDV29325.1 hypothetical protein DXV75_02425 [Alteromonas aestuariivivens]